MGAKIPAWAKEQLKLRRTFDDWVTAEMNKYEDSGFKGVTGDRGGHAMDEAGGYTRSFAGAYCLSGDQRIPVFMKQFRDDWNAALNASGHFYHGYDSNEGGDYITHTAEAFSQFLLNVLYMDTLDQKTIHMVDDGAEHLGNWHPDVQDWYDWDRHMFLSYFLGTKSPYHKPPYNFQTPRHFRVLQIAVAAYETTGNERYLDLCKDYCDFWAEAILDSHSDEDAPTHFYRIGGKDFQRFSQEEQYKKDRRFTRYYEHFPADTAPADIGDGFIPYQRIKEFTPAYHVLHDVMMTWLEIYKYSPQEKYKAALRRLMAGWVGLGQDSPSQIAGVEPHCGVHLPKYRDFTGDTSLDAMYLDQWPNGPCSYLITGQEDRLTGSMDMAKALLSQALLRNSGSWGEKFVVNHACARGSNAGTSSADVAPALFMPAFGGLNSHYGRAPWVNVLYYTDGRMGLPAGMAVLYVPAVNGGKPGVKLFNAGSESQKVSVRPVNPAKPGTLKLLQQPKPEDLIDSTIEPGELVHVEF